MNSPKIPDSVLVQIEEHVKSVTDREVGGVLVGTVTGGEVDPSCDIVAAIPALKAVGAQANVTFTHEVWDEALSIVDREYPDHRIVGWYHSHPDFGVFLSEYDLFIHKNFFPLPGMMALVADPVRGDAGWFTTVGDEVQQVASYRISPVPSQLELPDMGSSRANVLPAILIGAVVAVVAFAVGWAISPDGGGTDEEIAAAREELIEARADVELLESQLDASAAAATTVPDTSVPDTSVPDTDPTPTTPPGVPAPATDGGELSTPEISDPVTAVEVVYVVEANDSLWRVAERFYGDGNRWNEIAEANDVDGGLIEPGDELRIPHTAENDRGFEIRIAQ